MSDLPWVDEIETRTHADRQYISFRPDLALIQVQYIMVGGRKVGF